MTPIPQSEVSFQPHSFGDPDGRVFFWKGELYRGISHDRTAFFTDLFERDVLGKLMQQHLVIRSERTDFAFDGYGMVLRHHRVPFVSYPQEWCGPMYKDAALAYLELHGQLWQHGLTLKDTHPWNFLFEGTRPVFVDVTSIRPANRDGDEVDYLKFSRYYLYPLILMFQGQERIARCLLAEYEGILPSDFSKLTNGRDATVPLITRFAAVLRERVPQRCLKLLAQPARSVRSLLRSEGNADSRIASLDRLKRQVEEIAPSTSSIDPSQNGGISAMQLSPEDASNEIQGKLNELISTIDPRSVLVIGAAASRPALEAARAGKTVVCFDTDSSHISRTYCNSRAQNLDLLPLVMDFTDPTPSRGLASHVSIAAADRLRCEMVLARGLIVRAVLERHLRLDQIVGGLAQFSKRWLIVDFIPNLKDSVLAQRTWYELDNVIDVLSTHFTSVTPIYFDTASDVLLLCEK